MGPYSYGGGGQVRLDQILKENEFENSSSQTNKIYKFSCNLLNYSHEENILPITDLI